MARREPVFPLIPLLLLLGCALPAQRSLPLRVVGEGRLVVKARISREGVEMERHLLVDLMCPAALAYHAREALFLDIRERRGAEVDLRIGETTLAGVPVLAVRLREMERLTRDLAGELEQVPLVGILGWPAFRDHRVVIDPRARRLVLESPAVAGDLPAEERENPPLLVPLLLDRGPPALAGDLAGAQKGRLFLATGRPRSFLLSGAVAAAGMEEAPIRDLTAGDVSLTGVVPFRRVGVEGLPYRLPGPLLGALGWDFLRRFHLTLDGVNRVLILRRVDFEPFPKVEQAYLIAESRGLAGLEGFLAGHPEGPFARRAAAQVFARRRDQGVGTAAELAAAGRRWAALLPPEERAPVFVEVARALLQLHPVPEEAIRVIGEGIEAGRVAREKEASYRLQHLAGRYWLEQEEWRRARRHLINAVYGLLHEGPVNIDYGRAWEGLGKEVRAFGAYLRALLDIERSGPEALLRLEGLRPGKRRTGFVGEVAASLEGRIKSFSMPGEPDPAPVAEPHRPLVEFFTCAESRGATGAGLALEGILRRYGDRIALLAYHLHAPAPDPLAVRAGRERAGELGLERVPAIYVDGEPVLVGGVRASAAARAFRRVEESIAAARKKTRRWRLAGEARYDAGARTIAGELRVSGPPGRVQLWLAARRAIYPGADRLFIQRGVARFRLHRGDAQERIPFRADLKGIWAALAWDLDALEMKLIEQGFSFRWKPARPDPAELVLTAFVTDGGSPAAREALTIVPAGPAAAAAEKGEEREKEPPERRGREGSRK